MLRVLLLYISYCTVLNSERNIVSDTISVVVVFQIKTCYCCFLWQMRRKKNENLLFHLTINFNFFVSLEIYERCYQINEVQKFSIILNISNQVSPRPFSNSVPPRSVYTENPIIVSTTANYIQVVEEVLIIILQGEVKNDISNCYPFVTVIHIHFYRFDVHFIMYYLQSRQWCGWYQRLYAHRDLLILYIK